MEKTTEQQIQEIIKKNLPEEVGALLKERLIEAELDRQSLTEALEKIEKLKADYARVNEIVIDLKSKLSMHESLDKREMNISKREREAEIESLKIQLAESEKRANLISSYTTGLVRNTVFRKTILDSENQAPFYDNNGNYVCPAPINKSLTETKEED